MRWINAYLAPIVVLVLSVAFYWGNFALVLSETAHDVQLGTAVEHDAKVNSGFCIYPNSKLGKLVAEELKSRGEKVLLFSSPIQCDGQFLAVWVEWLNTTYTPLFSKGEIRIGAIYSSAGDPSHYLIYRNTTDKREALISFEKSRRPQIRGYVILTVSDTSKGIMSFRGYSEHMMNEAAKALADSLEKLQQGEDE